MKAVKKPVLQSKPAVDVTQPSATTSEPVRPPETDNIILIDGIGPAFAERLRRAGIMTYRALAEASDEYLAQVTGATPQRVQREKWRNQARIFGHLP